ncbi:MAG: T9SS type A sorting domain-containing protein [Bacteroidales bacterium]|nr:T9SS type A sorting domain-containing protein [Bacteroidales bacterium]
MKKNILLSIFLAFAMFCGAQSPCWDGTVAESYNGGDGTIENPYQIATPQQLALLAQQTNDGTGGNACYILTEDICLNDMDDNINWIPIGYYNLSSDYKVFSGIFDGNGHTISNLYNDNSNNWKSIGLFGLASNAVIKNVIISNATIISQSSIKAGMIAAFANNTDVLNSTADGMIIANGTLGGIIGNCSGISDTTFIANCVNNVVLENTSITGGIVGHCDSRDNSGAVSSQSVVVIENCINYSDISSWCAGGISADIYGNVVVKKCENYGKMQSVQAGGGIIGEIGLFDSYLSDCLVEDCVNHESADVISYASGGIAGRSGMAIVTRCVNNALITAHIHGDTLWAIGIAGGITGVGGVVSNCYNRGDVTATKDEIYDIDYYVYLGGITGTDESQSESHACNVYNTGNIIIPDLTGLNYNNTIELAYGNIVGYSPNHDFYYNCYWLDDDDLPACGNEEMPNLPGSCAFIQGTTPTSWVLNEAQYGTTDLLDALNNGSLGQCTWLEDVTGINDGYPIIEMDGEPDYQLVGDEWYYKITNSNGTISYQHLVHENDSTINDDKVKVIVKTNTLYDLRIDQTSHEYIYEENNKVYWWNKTLQEFTVLYDFGANVGDEWTITAANNSVTVHVDDVGYIVKDARWFKALVISDENDIFSGTVVCGIGHLTSFFPEKLMENRDDFEVDGIRCYWKDDILLYKESDTDCDAIYEQYHLGVDENEIANEILIYPNPTSDYIIIILSSVQKTPHCDVFTREYRITNILGEIVASGRIASENQQIDVSSLPEGMYFITIDKATMEFMKK